MSDSVDTVTVIIPFFNASKTIQRALRTAICQSVPPEEIILVDDHSNDVEYELLTKSIDLVRGTGVPEIRLIRLEENEGPASARNRGWELAKSKWIAFLDADDGWHNRHIEILLKVALSDDALLCFSETEISHPEDVQEACSKELTTPTVFDVHANALLVRNFIATPAVLVRRDIPGRFTPGRRYAEDHELWIRISRLGRVRHVRLPLTILFKHPGEGGLTGNRRLMLKGEYETFKLLRQEEVINFSEYAFALLFLALRALRRFVIQKIARRRKSNQ